MFKYTKHFLTLVSCFASAVALTAFQTQPTAKEIVEKTYYNQRSHAFTMDISMEVIRPKWTRELTFTTWSLGNDLGMMRIKSPAKERGISFLRIKAEGWNWMPSIDRVIKISPSQMSQSWMGSDFTNEDLLKEASIVHDYYHTIIKEEMLDGKTCYKIEATPKDGAAVVWGKLLLWIDKAAMLQMKTEYYSETGALINTLTQSNFKQIDGKKIATELTMSPSKKEGYKTIVKIHDADFHAALATDFFSIAKMKQLN